MMQWLVANALQWMVGAIAVAALLAAGVGMGWLTVVGWTHINREFKRNKRRKRRRYNQ